MHWGDKSIMDLKFGYYQRINIFRFEDRVKIPIGVY